MDRAFFLKEIDKGGSWDVIVIGGGATGLGVAVDAASRGYRTLLLEQSDFAKGTSSRSTKLVHGGVRYLAQGDLKMVFEALRERGYLLRNAPHITGKQSFIIPVYNWWNAFIYTMGLKAYEWMAGRLGIGHSKFLSAKEVADYIPTIRQKGLKGGVLYYDGQFDDARLAVNLAQTCADHGGTVLNYAKVTALRKNEQALVKGVEFSDLESGKNYQVESRVVVNATGVFVDDLLRLDDPDHELTVQPSQGVHVVLDQKFLKEGRHAMMIPATSDGRVLFIIPWHRKLLVGTTDTPLQTHSIEPVAQAKEIDFILETAGRYLIKPPERKDVLSVFAGLRPLALPDKGVKNTKDISRSHKLVISSSGVITITGGKWTTYRKMAEDTLEKAIEIGKLPARACITKALPIHGFQREKAGEDFSGVWNVYGNDLSEMAARTAGEPDGAQKLLEGWDYTHAQVIWAVRNEMARTVEDVLARRLRVLFLDAGAAEKMAPMVADIMAAELGRDDNWKRAQTEGFCKLAARYKVSFEKVPLSNV